eukprot:CAMPEP_0196163804 /NCGR_PEP_ID=MMETSP0911-20130528/100_1 /TAXON_ID=49265 /ORGANISM="Thalassiosira rotula, Strain GSO102" /LENGTH=465 /DNA_ID=CAMNT_0041428807 /DNA_START=70 /DNA_END=1467 /DNA_ORIENTATION=-
MGRIINDHLKDPTERQKREVKKPCNDVMRVLLCKGVDGDVLQRYEDDFKEQIKFNHASLIGVIDPTGLIPSGKVFIPGMGNKTPSRVFVTRNPCTEGKDGIVAEVASSRDFPDDVVEFFDSLGFGALVFPLGDELPTKINNGDLDGDPYFCMWDEEVLRGINLDSDDDRCEGKVLTDDDVVGYELIYKIDGIDRAVKVVHKLKEDPDTYLVETDDKKGPQTHRELTRDQIFAGRHVLTEVVGHRYKGKGKSKDFEFGCKWSSGGETWESSKSIRKLYPVSPEPLSEYAQSKGLLSDGLLPTNFCKWVKKGLGEGDMTKITDHKTVHGNIEVLCHYSNGNEEWVPMDEAKEDCKIFLGAYAKDKNLFGQPGWEKMQGYWLSEVHDVMCKQMRSNEINSFVSTLYKKWTQAFDINDVGRYHWETTTWGSAYKQSLELDKHGGLIRLPLLMYRKLTPKQQKYADTVSS